MNYTGVDPKHELYQGRLSWALETCLLNHMNKQKFCQKQSNITPARDPKQRELCKALWGSLGLSGSLSGALWGYLQLSGVLRSSLGLSTALKSFKGRPKIIAIRSEENMLIAANGYQNHSTKRCLYTRFRLRVQRLSTRRRTHPGSIFRSPP